MSDDIISDLVKRNKKVKVLEIRKEFEFEAAHHLPNHTGKCKNLHGHTYRLAVTVCGKINPETGMVMDFGNLKQFVNDHVIEELDHKNLNEVFDFDPTAENMVHWIWDKLEGIGVNVSKVELWETSTSCAILSMVTI